MLHLDQQVTSLEISKKIFSLNIKLETLFYWEIFNETAYGLNYVPYCMALPFDSNPLYKRYAAYTPSDILSLLPKIVLIKENQPFNSFRFRLEKITIINELIPENNYIANYYCDSTECAGPEAWLQRKLYEENARDINLSNCLGKLLMMIYEDERLK